MPLPEEQRAGNRFAARRPRYGGEGRRALPAGECYRIIRALRCAVSWDTDLYRYIERHIRAFHDRRSKVASAVNRRVGHLERAHGLNAAPAWQVGEYGLRLIRRLCRQPASECALPGLALELGYAYLDGLLSVNEWVRLLELLGRLGPPLGMQGLEGALAQARDIQPDRPVLMPGRIGRSTELYRIDPVLYRHAALLIDDWRRGTPVSGHGGFS